LKKSSFIINILGLQIGEHQFEFKILPSFLKENDKESYLIEEANVDVTAILKKSSLMIECALQMKGILTLACDRSLDLFEYPIDTNHTIFYKYGEAYEEVSEDLIKIPKDQQQLDFADLIYDFLNLAVPSRKIHPRFADEENEEDGVFYSTQTEQEEENADTPTEETSTDPRWEQLKKLKL